MRPPHTWFSPALAGTLRAYCERNRDYRDFVLSRFRGEADLMDSSSNGPANDEGWNTAVAVAIAPDTRLSPHQRGIIETDYGMRDGACRSKRAARWSTTCCSCCASTPTPSTPIPAPSRSSSRTATSCAAGSLPEQVSADPSAIRGKPLHPSAAGVARGNAPIAAVAEGMMTMLYLAQP